MKHAVLIFLLVMVVMKFAAGQSIGDPISFIPWKKVVLSNDAEFKAGKLNGGSGFLIKYKNDTIACTARDFTGTTYTRGKMLYIKDFANEMKYWRMYVSDDPSQYVVLDSLFQKERIEKKVLNFFVLGLLSYFFAETEKQKFNSAGTRCPKNSE